VQSERFGQKHGHLTARHRSIGTEVPSAATRSDPRSGEIERRRERLGIPELILEATLATRSTSGMTYRERLDRARTERELSDIYEDLIGRVPLGRRFLENGNPVRTGGPMQVSVAFARAQSEEKRYPYAVVESIRDEVFTRRGGLYFGIAHLLDYPASYDRYVYRFAGFNAGRYASRNAAPALHVVKMEGWRREDYFDQTALPWINPSPNLRSVNEEILYPGIALLVDVSLAQLGYDLRLDRLERLARFQRLVASSNDGGKIVGVHDLLPGALVALLEGQAGVFSPSAVVAAATAAAGDARPDDRLQHVGEQPPPLDEGVEPGRVEEADLGEVDDDEGRPLGHCEFEAVFRRIVDQRLGHDPSCKMT